ncbi:hypothetical protein HYX16_05695 [Candidatus Woesearchaeota archaeon]|nr:hypothetical protein [Candidatus Woesearchaeota archaeon]
MTEINLLGVIHTDLNGRARIERALEKFYPDNVVSEVHYDVIKQQLGFREYLDTIKGKRAIKKRILERQNIDANPDTLDKFLDVTGYEIVIPYDHCKKRKKEIICPEEIMPLNELIKKLKESQAGSEYDKDLKMTPEELTRRNEVDYIKERLPVEIPADEIELLMSVDKEIAEKVRELKGNTLVVVGLFHLIGAYYNLARRLKGSKVYRLNEF